VYGIQGGRLKQACLRDMACIPLRIIKTKKLATSTVQEKKMVFQYDEDDI
jgi:hypothetical protein